MNSEMPPTKAANASKSLLVPNKACLRDQFYEVAAGSAFAGIKNPAVNAVGNSSFELITKQVGPASAAFDFQ